MWLNSNITLTVSISDLPLLGKFHAIPFPQFRAAHLPPPPVDVAPLCRLLPPLPVAPPPLYKVHLDLRVPAERAAGVDANDVSPGADAETIARPNDCGLLAERATKAARGGR